MGRRSMPGSTMAPLLERVLVPVATDDDARVTARALVSALGDQVGTVVGVHAIEKGGGAPDKAPLEARQTDARELLDFLREALEAEGVDVETEILYGTDVVDAIIEAAAEREATAIAFCPRPAGRLSLLLAGDTARALLERSPVPVLSLPPEGDAA